MVVSTALPSRPPRFEYLRCDESPPHRVLPAFRYRRRSRCFRHCRRRVEVRHAWMEGRCTSCPSLAKLHLAHCRCRGLAPSRGPCWPRTGRAGCRRPTLLPLFRFQKQPSVWRHRDCGMKRLNQSRPSCPSRRWPCCCWSVSGDARVSGGDSPRLWKFGRRVDTDGGTAGIPNRSIRTIQVQ